MQPWEMPWESESRDESGLTPAQRKALEEADRAGKPFDVTLDNGELSPNKVTGEPIGAKAAKAPWELDWEPYEAPPPPKAPSASDYAKSFAAGAASGTGAIAQGGGELLARGINAVAGTELRAINPLQAAIDWLNESQSEGAKTAVANTQIEGDITSPSTWSFGKNPTVSGLALQGLNAIGQFAPNLAMGLATAGASIPAQVAVGATVGGLQALGGGAEEERGRFLKMTPDELTASSSLYRELTGRRVAPDVARKAVAEAAALGGGLGNAIPSAGEGAFENFLIGAITKGRWKIPPLFGTGVAGKVATGAIGGGLMGGTEEAVEQASQNLGSNIAVGGNRPLGEDTLQQFVMGMIAEGTAGSGGAIAQHVLQPETAAPAPPPPPVTTHPMDTVRDIIQATSVDEAIAATERAINAPALELPTIATAPPVVPAATQAELAAAAAELTPETNPPESGTLPQETGTITAQGETPSPIPETPLTEGANARAVENPVGATPTIGGEAEGAAAQRGVQPAATASPESAPRNEKEAALQELRSASEAIRANGPEQTRALTGPMEEARSRAEAAGASPVEIIDAIHGRKASAAPTEETPAGVEDFTTRRGEVKTFKTDKAAATYARQKTNKVPGNFAPRQLAGGDWVLSRKKQERTPAQRANDARLRRQRTTIDTARDSLATAMGKLGGLDLNELERDGFDPKDANLVRSGVFGRPALRRNGGLSLDGMAELLAQHGFDVLDEKGRPDASRLRDLIDEVLEGRDVYTPEGHEYYAARADEAAQAKARAEGLPDEHATEESGYNDLTPEERAAVEAAVDDDLDEVAIDFDAKGVSGDEADRIFGYTPGEGGETEGHPRAAAGAEPEARGEGAQALARGSPQEVGAGAPQNETTAPSGAVSVSGITGGPELAPLSPEQASDAFGQFHHLFDDPEAKVRIADKVKVYNKAHGWMSLEEARAKIEEWKAHARAQGKNPESRSANADKVVLSLFDYTGTWARPWEEAGYQVYTFDIQHGEDEDIRKFGIEYINDQFGSFDGLDIHAILAAVPCTDFAVSGARHFAAKDADGRTQQSIELVEKTLATIEYFKPAVWAIENPVGRIEDLGGLPPWRMSFDPNAFGSPYTKKTILWGRFNADLPIAPVEPTEGSKMWAKFGGKSQATKNARSETPEGFAYAFFMANNAIDHEGAALAGKYDRLDAKLIAKALAAGATEEQISNAIDDFYYQDLDDEAANETLRQLAQGKTFENAPTREDLGLPTVEHAMDEGEGEEPTEDSDLAEQVRASAERTRDETKGKGQQTKRGKGDLLWKYGLKTTRPEGDLSQRWYDYRTEATLAYNTAPKDTPREVLDQFRKEVELANEHIARIEATPEGLLARFQRAKVDGAEGLDAAIKALKSKKVSADELARFSNIITDIEGQFKEQDGFKVGDRVRVRGKEGEIDRFVHIHAKKGKPGYWRALITFHQPTDEYPNGHQQFNDLKDLKKSEAPGLELTGETEGQIRTREAKQAKAAKAKQEREAAPAPEDFSLTGSNRAVDVARAKGQNELFAPETKKAPREGERVTIGNPEFADINPLKKATVRVGPDGHVWAITDEDERGRSWLYSWTGDGWNPGTMMTEGIKEAEDAIAEHATPSPFTRQPLPAVRKSIDDIPPALLQKIKVEVEVMDEESGEPDTEVVTAARALKDNADEIAAYEKLLDCVRAG